MTRKIKYILFLIFIFIMSCSNDKIIYDENNKMLNMSQIKENNIILLGNGFCKDCLIHLIEYFNKNNDSYIVVYPNYIYDNLTKITIKEMLLSYKVDSRSIYWINKDDYENNYSRMKVPFLIIKKELRIIYYDNLFDKDGYVLTKHLND